MAEEEQKRSSNRDKQIIRTGYIGIITNILLAIFKAMVGLLSNSIAIILDALNNLSDVLSSVITIIGMKLATRPADKKHPMGHGRMEYLSALVIVAIVLATGVVSFAESIKKIITPAETHYTWITFLIVTIAIVTKLILGQYTKRVGEKVNSSSLIASGADALFDALISGATLVGAAITLIWNINLDGWIGAIIALALIRAGIDMLRGTVDSALGERIDSEFAGKIKTDIATIKNVEGAYDLVLNNYGPETLIGSIEIGLSDQLSPMNIYRTTLSVKQMMYEKYGIMLAVGVYVTNTHPGPELDLENEVTEMLLKEKYVLSIHGFYCDLNRKVATMDVVKDFEIENTESFRNELYKKLRKIRPDVHFNIWFDTDYSD